MLAKVLAFSLKWCKLKVKTVTAFSKVTRNQGGFDHERISSI
ncbi:hypothetical protein HMPREF3219_0201120 [Streptococcus salivarius]|nr:hypothetical protein HMPREF3219_0201120 [Streptococcus salivarius]